MPVVSPRAFWWLSVVPLDSGTQVIPAALRTVLKLFSCKTPMKIVGDLWISMEPENPSQKSIFDYYT
jgi:hypothetical protein